MEEKKERKEIHSKRISKKEMEELTSKIDEELQRFIKEGRYKDVLIMMGNLGNYSLNNQMYILMQKPNARTVHGMRQWNRLGRHVIPGEKSIRIFSPILAKEEKEETKGEESDKGYVCRGFRLGYVFDVSQTEGKEISAFRFDEEKLVREKGKILEGLRKTIGDEGYSIRYAGKEELGDGCATGFATTRRRKSRSWKTWGICRRYPLPSTNAGTPSPIPVTGRISRD